LSNPINNRNKVKQKPVRKTTTTTNLTHPTPTDQLLNQLLLGFNQILNNHNTTPTITTTKNICKESRLVDFPEFKGGNQDPIDWLEAFDRACKANCVGMDRKMDVVASYLKGTAFIWFNTSGAREWKNSLNQGHSFKHLFEKQFCDPFKMSQWKHQLRNRKQWPGETIDEYTSAMEELWKRIDPRRRRTELDRISEYIEGLRAEFIVPVQSSMPQNVKEAINKAKAIEMAFSMGMDLSAYSMLPGYLQSMNGGMVPA